MGMKKYIKRGVKYVVRGYQQPIVKVETSQRKADGQFRDKVFLVTGGGSGLGLAISKRLAKDGAKVIISGRNVEKLGRAAKEIGESNCTLVGCDVRNVDAAIKMVDDIFDKFGRLDGVVNNAGVSLHEWDFLKVTLDGYDTQFETNLRGGYFVTQQYVRRLLERGESGNVLFISSERGTMCDDLPYGMTKRAIDSLVEALSYKYYKQGIRVNAIAPGVTATDMTGISAEGDLYSESNSGRVFLPEEVAEVAAFLLGDFSRCISGQIIHTNGGNHIKRGY